MRQDTIVIQQSLVQTISNKRWFSSNYVESYLNIYNNNFSDS